MVNSESEWPHQVTTYIIPFSRISSFLVVSLPFLQHLSVFACSKDFALPNKQLRDHNE